MYDDITVFLETKKEPLVFSSSANITCAESLCLLVCKHEEVNISPLTRSLFALRLKGSKIYLKDDAELFPPKKYELRLRFKVRDASKLKSLDEKVFNYYFWQIRNDVLKNQIPEIRYPAQKNEIFGLGVTDMYRAMKQGENVQDLLRNYRQYIHKDIVKKHSLFIKKPVKMNLSKWESNPQTLHTVDYIQMEYVEQASKLAPNYLAEVYSVYYKEELMKIVVNPYHKEHPGLYMHDVDNYQLIHVCTMDELCFIGRISNNELVINRSNAPPLVVRFTTDSELASFISCCSGYYRLMVKWTFNLSKDDLTPSLEDLLDRRWHGPVGGEFSYWKLEAVTKRIHGSYIVRECENNYNVYYIDVCTNSHDKKIETFKMELKNGKYILDGEIFDSFEELVSLYSSPGGKVYLKERLPPRENDKSQLLLCAEMPKMFGKQISQEQLQEALKNCKSPLYIRNDQIVIVWSSPVDRFMDITETYRAFWNVDGDSNVKPFEVSYKTLKSDKYLKDFLDLANRMACVRSEYVVKLYGITLMRPTALVMECLPYGRLDAFLKQNEKNIDELKLLKITVYLARALWDLSEANCVHGKIRCRELMLTSANIESFHIKLADPGVHYNYTDEDRHWIPVEYYPEMNLARKSTMADVWAFATTAWEIFSYGVSPNEASKVLHKIDFEEGMRLQRPAACNQIVWATLRRCWMSDLHSRPNTQALMRDLSYLMHQRYIPGPRQPLESTSSSIDDIKTYDLRQLRSFGSGSTALMEPMSGEGFSPYEEVTQPAILQMRGLLEFEKIGQVQILSTVAKGNFGIVKKGLLEYYEGWGSQVVAVKELKRNPNLIHSDEEIEKEMNIMKSLQHNNIVRILGFCKEPEMMIVMEYLEHGALESYISFNRHLLNHQHLLKYAEQVAMGMDYLKTKSIVHRDLAARNILVVDETHVKISDFGLARFTNCGKFYKTDSKQPVPIKWYAPEAILSASFSYESDVWSYGVTLWEMFTYCREEVPPVDTENVRRRAECFKQPEGCPSAVYQLMQDCWHLNVKDRPDFVTISIRINTMLRRGT